MSLSNCYIVRHRIWSDNGACYDESYQKFMFTQTSGFQNKYFDEAPSGAKGNSSLNKETTSNSLLTIYPNPTSEGVTISLTSGLNEKFANKIELFDLQGRQVKGLEIKIMVMSSTITQKMDLKKLKA